MVVVTFAESRPLWNQLAEDSVGEAQEVPRREEAASGCPGDGLMLPSGKLT